MPSRGSAGLLLAFCLLTTGPWAPAAEWREVLGPSKGSVPPPPPGPVTWLSDLPAALARAREENRPVFVTLRCLPCKQCADFDREVLEGGPRLDPWLNRFVTVRLTDASQLDFRLLPAEGFQDLDLSWWGYFLSPQGSLYGIFGGRDHVSDTTRISVEGLVQTLRRVLDWHYDPRRPSWKLDGPAPDLRLPPVTPRDLPGYASWSGRRPRGERDQSCIHCHSVADILRQPALDARTFDKQRDIEVWPLPENVGLVLNRDHGLLVERVLPDSAAERAGLRAGDELGAAAGRVLFGQADFRGVLHRAPRTGRLEVVWKRGDSVQSAFLPLLEGWRQTPAGWRMSISQGNIGADPGFFPLRMGSDRRKRHGVMDGVMAVEPYMGSNRASPAYQAGVRQHDLVIAVNGKTPDLAGREFLVWFRQQFDWGDRVELTLAGPDGTRRIVRYTLKASE